MRGEMGEMENCCILVVVCEVQQLVYIIMTLWNLTAILLNLIAFVLSIKMILNVNYVIYNLLRMETLRVLHLKFCEQRSYIILRLIDKKILIAIIQLFIAKSMSILLLLMIYSH